MPRKSREGVEITPYKGGRVSRVNVRATENVKQKLDDLAAQLGVSTADIIERLILEEWERRTSEENAKPAS